MNTTAQNNELNRRQTSNLTEPQKEDVVWVAAPVDIFENKDEILVVADFPGVSSDALNIRMEGSELIIEGTQSDYEGSSDLRRLGFSRAFRVPNTVDPSKVTAELSSGVLRVHLAKSEASKPKRIEVKVS